MGIGHQGTNMYVLGLTYYGQHDASASLIRDGELIAACEEERFDRIKHSRAFPINSIRYCLKEGGIELRDIEHIGFYMDYRLNFLRKSVYFARSFPRSFNLFKIQSNFIHIYGNFLRVIRQNFNLNEKVRSYLIEHHASHLSSAFFPSPYEEAAILSIDAMGEWATTAFGVGQGNKIKILKRIYFPHSLGFLYLAFTKYLGFEWGDEYKVMGLSSYGDPRRYYDKVRNIVRLTKDGFELDLSYFTFQNFDFNNYVSQKFILVFGEKRIPGSEMQQRFADLAASLQMVLEETAIHLVNYLHRLTKKRNLCMAGGVALNCVMNGRILRESPFHDIFIQPASHDGGTSLGVALYIYHTLLGNKRGFQMKHAYWGPSYSESKMRQAIEKKGLDYEERDDIENVTAKLLSQGKIIGWFQGRMEFGPRALGNRSILADPRREEMKDIVNERIKFREEFRPFAPAVLEEEVGKYFDCNCKSPFMLLVFRVKEDMRHIIPAVTHVDGTSRVQTVSKDTNPRFWQLIKEFEKETSVPVLLNTSFNVKGEPIVCTPSDAINCFLSSGIDHLVLGNYLVKKNE
ncbi:MAG: carbamoyltransferase [bacterium]|nr:carbamoyltransferase [bacterium]